MYIAEVIGTMVATRKTPELSGMKFLILRRWEGTTEEPVKKNKIGDVAVDSVGAGIGDRVLVVTGASARMAVERDDAPVDAVIVGIIDSWELGEPD